MGQEFTGEIYSDWMKSTQEKKYREIILEFILPIKDKIDLSSDRVLDVGVGKGWFEKKLHEREIESSITGLDVDKTDLAIEGIDFVVGDGNRMPFEDSSFDFVISFDTIHLLKRPKEIERVVSEGGYALISTYCNERNFKSRGDKVKSLFDMEILKEGVVGDPSHEMSYVVLFRNGSVV
ncbi:MAG: class I SAM-dependent methyltransferase [Candidatus Aenigmatarchaeota archaeon]